MLRLRPYKPCDASIILGWIKSEDAFRKWSADCNDELEYYCLMGKSVKCLEMELK